jgi:hypothetical protein
VQVVACLSWDPHDLAPELINRVGWKVCFRENGPNMAPSSMLLHIIGNNFCSTTFKFFWIFFCPQELKGKLLKRTVTYPGLEPGTFGLAVSLNTTLQSGVVSIWCRSKLVSIKRNKACLFGAIYVFETVRLSWYLSGDLKLIVDPIIQRNGYYVHSECEFLVKNLDSILTK